MTTLAEMVPPEFWPTIDKLDQLSAKFGGPPVRENLEKIAFFDPDAIRGVIPVWGADGGDGLPDAMGKGLNGAITKVTAKIEDRWEGAAWDAFAKDMADVQSLLAGIGEPGSMVGHQLKEFVDKMELSWLEIIGIGMAAIGMIEAIIGLVVAVEGAAAAPATGGFSMLGTAAGLIMAVAGMVLAVVSVMLTTAQSLQPRIEAVLGSINRFNAEMKRLTPLSQGGGAKPLPTDQWKQKNIDPDS